jgi:hypothetical protein
VLDVSHLLLPPYHVRGLDRIEHTCYACHTFFTGRNHRQEPQVARNAGSAGHLVRPTPRRSPQFSRPAFFCRSFFRALLQANSCVRQLRGFCFPGSSRTPQVPPIKQPLALEAEALAWGCPRKMGQKKETFLCPT